jgi:hypothetical protein
MGHFHYADLFATVPGIVVAVIGTVTAVLTAVVGKFKSFQLPYESAPGLSRGFLNFVLFVPFVVCFVSVSPQSATIFLIAALIGVPAAWFMHYKYGQTFANHRYVRPRLAGWFRRKIRDEIIVGGTKLTAAAAQKVAQGESLQTILASAEYQPDEIWVRDSRTSIQQKIEFFYYSFFLFAVVSVVAGALSLQALITHVAPLHSAAKVWDAGHSEAAQ